MDSIGITQSVILPTKTIPAPSSQGAPVVPLAVPAPRTADHVQINPEAARQAAPKKADIANPEILGTGKFVMFQMGGQLITRFTQINNGIVNVTYVPRQELPKISGDGGPVLNIEA